MAFTDVLDTRFYPRHSSSWDESLFRHHILSYLQPEHTILDLGAGRGRLAQMNFRGLVKHVCGLDPEEAVMSNSHLDEAKVGFAENIPWQNNSFAVVISDNVIEHLTDPIAVFCEVYRVLKPGGLFLAKTPNRYHYVAAAASLTPYRFHQWFNAKRGTESHDTFPTVYRTNTRRRLHKVAERAGLLVVDITVGAHWPIPSDYCTSVLSIPLTSCRHCACCCLLASAKLRSSSEQGLAFKCHKRDEIAECGVL